MMTHPRFLPHFRVEVVPPELVFLVHENGYRVLRGAQYTLLAPLLEEGLSADQIVERLKGKVKPAEAYYCLARLEKQGLLFDSKAEQNLGEAAFWSSQGLDPNAAKLAISEARVRLKALGVADPGLLADALDSLGVATDRTGEGLSVVVVDDYLNQDLSGLNAEQLAAGKPWLLCKPGGSVAWLGPLFVPGKTGCWECLATRIRRNREVETYLVEQKDLPNLVTSTPSLPTTLAQANNQAATEIARFLASGENSHLQGSLLTVDFGSLAWERHVLTKSPTCEACGTPVSNEMEPMILESRTVLAKEDAGYRTCSPEEAWKSLRDHVSPITGVVKKLTRSDQSDGVAPVYVAGHNHAQFSHGYHALKAGLRSQSSGKGKTDMQARVSGVCEAIERYSGVFRGDERRRRATFAELGSQAIHPSRCMLYSDDQYRRRDELNPTLIEMHSIPRPFDEEERIEWTPLWSFTALEPRFLPTSYCYYNHQDEESRQCPACFADSNGNAAGSTREDAILQGFLELVERDAVALWWYNRLTVPGVDLNSLQDPYIARLERYYHSLQRKFWVLDVTSDLGIPTFAAVSCSTADGPTEILVGFGSHLDARLAVLRSIEEMNQTIPHLLEWKQGKANIDALTDKFWRRATLRRQTYLVPSEESRAITPPSNPNLDLKEVVESCQKVVEDRGLEFLVLDQTRADIGLPVVKVVVPGLRHFWPRFAPGRLYDVPVQRGQIDQPRAESELNRIPVIL
jgi:oxazoline/thiazoline synthase